MSDPSPTPTPTPTFHRFGGPVPHTPAPWPPPPARRISMGWVAAIAAIGTVLVSGVVFCATYTLTGGPEVDPTPLAASGSVSPGPRATLRASTGSTPSVQTTPAPSGSVIGLQLGTVRPTLRAGTARKVFAERFGGKPYTFDFAGWPFAFQAPNTWGCINSSRQYAGMAVKICINEAEPGTKQSGYLVLRRCEARCTSTEIDKLHAAFLPKTGNVVTVAARTKYVEVATNDKGLYEVNLSHVFADPATGELVWQLGVHVEAKPADRDNVRFILNSVLHQAG